MHDISMESASGARLDDAVRETPESASPRLSLPLKFAYASSAFGVAVLFNSAAVLMLFYLTTIVGIAGWKAGLILMVSKLYDAVSDPVAGWLSDRHVSPAGRRRPFLLWGTLVSGLAMALIFSVPFHGDRPVVWLYVLIVNLIYTTGYSLYNVPHLAMATEMTNGYHERSVLQGWRIVAASAGTAVATIGSGAILGVLGHRVGDGGRVVNSAADYAILGAFFTLLTVAGMIIGWAGTRGARFLEPVKSTSSWQAQTSSFFANRAAMIIIGVKTAQLIGIASTSAATFFMLVDILKRSPADLPALGLPVLATSVVATPILAWLSKRIGKKGGYLIGALSTAAGALSWIWAEPADPLYYLMLRGVVTGVAFSANVMFATSMLNDAMELDALRTGLRREGLYSALYSFVDKFGGAVGPAVVGAALSVAGFDKTASITAANAEQVRQATLLGVAYIPTGCAVIAVTLLCFYRLDQKALKRARETSLTRAPA
jgi:GPH family glycoside/pentoside/hexuronide:cation symporter